eukprot:CAMPEP_0114579192 /NCGR_PEP_ID=MMETSP0125-20121206/3614_1 /TAXON_ID=485358 ORGANISM="Aristerostoma sp., Strain ATCC 50986" /NCGR_SAMPLE_ID=MMETSP0125 /ASSEMBLY_ACC=CAM_ASM_000245 /LENGTH=114 /DNA_ID=CAMNT_0001769781 /DNA_START=393 /DNA_END=737 /DNA_ORIENTATION=-
MADRVDNLFSVLPIVFKVLHGTIFSQNVKGSQEGIDITVMSTEQSKLGSNIVSKETLDSFKQAISSNFNLLLLASPEVEQEKCSSKTDIGEQVLVIGDSVGKGLIGHKINENDI